MTAAEFRRMALSLPDAVEASHMGHPDFRVAGKIFATLGYPSDRYGVVMLSSQDQDLMVRDYPKSFAPVRGSWGASGSTTVLLRGASTRAVATALESAWRKRAPKQKEKTAPRTAVAILILALACGGNDHARPADDSAATVTPAPAPAPATVVSAPVTELGIGPLRAGMTLAEARTALGTLDIRAGADTLGCDYIHSRNLPSGVNVMIVEGKVARIDVKTREVTTTEGARVGDSEQRVLSLYGKRASVGPHKYTDGHYVTIKPTSGDTTHLIVFETNADTVTYYRAGRVPYVQYVEGCS
jgi:hypothetical protein